MDFRDERPAFFLPITLKIEPSNTEVNVDIHASSTRIPYFDSVTLSKQSRASAHTVTNFSTPKAKNSDTFTISPESQKILAIPFSSDDLPDDWNIKKMDTNRGSQNVELNKYFSPSDPGVYKGDLLHNLPPLLLPTKNNIDALTQHLNRVLPGLLEQNNIPSAPSLITYDSHGRIQLPPDYAHAAEFKQALENNPTMGKEMRTLHAITSHYAEMQKSIPFHEEYAAAATQQEARALVQKYNYLFQENRPYSIITLEFSESGRLSISIDNEPLV